MKKLLKIIAPVLVLVVSIGVVQALSAAKPAPEKNDPAVLDYAEPEDLLKFGLIPEFIGRLPVAVFLEELTEDDLVRILTQQIGRAHV